MVTNPDVFHSQNNKMIDIAEEEYGIKIRKKSGAEQSKVLKEIEEKKSK